MKFWKVVYNIIIDGRLCCIILLFLSMFDFACFCVWLHINIKLWHFYCFCASLHPLISDILLRCLWLDDEIKCLIIPHLWKLISINWQKLANMHLRKHLDWVVKLLCSFLLQYTCMENFRSSGYKYVTSLWFIEEYIILIETFSNIYIYI